MNYRDSELRGFMLRVSPTGARSYAITYSRRHKNQTYTLGPVDRLPLGGKDGAREEARKLLARVALGEHPAEVRARARRAQLTVGALVDDALAAKKVLVLRPSTRRQWTWIAKKLIKPALEHEPAATLKRQRIRSWGAKLAERSANNANAAFMVLRRVFSWAIQNDKLEASPFVHLVAPATNASASSDRVLSAEELTRLLVALQELPGAYSDATLLLLLTMVRREAVLGSRFSELEDLDGKEPRWIVPAERNKGGRRQHLVPLSPAAAAVFRARLQRATSDIVFPRIEHGAGKTMPWSSRFVTRLRSKMGRMPRWTIHNFRHTAATHLREHLDVDRDLVRLLLGHSLGDVTARYDRAERLSDRRKALESWATYLASLRRSAAAETPSQDARRTRRAV